MIRFIMILAMLTGYSFAASTNKTAAASERETKVEHQASKIIVKSRAKGDSNAPWKTDREYPFMFSNNRKAKKAK